MWADTLATQYLFFTGKGGVGKTSLACATAVHLAETDGPVLLVSTDPASNLDEVLGVPLGDDPLPVPNVPGLFAANLDPEEAARQYRERAVAPYRELLPAAAIRQMEEQFSGACTTEIAAFDEFTRLLGSADVSNRFAHIIFDTAPTGHTLRLLSLPAAWSGFIDASTTGVSCLGPLSALKDQESLYRASLDTLKDRRRTTVVLVSRPDEPSLREAGRASGELACLGMNNQHLIVNGVFAPVDTTDPVAAALADRGRCALAGLPSALKPLPQEHVPLLAGTVVGLEAVRRLLHPQASPPAGIVPPIETGTEDLGALVAGIAASGHGVVMTMGKGGVGKTTLAAAIARRLAALGHAVLLTTTDPAAHVEAAIRSPVANLEVQRIDPAVEVSKYSEEVIRNTGPGLDAEGLALLEEDLRSPCTEEIAVFRAFAAAVQEGIEKFVVIDTAPTGHTILLLDAAEAYHREVLRMQAGMPESVRELLPRLRDPQFTRVILVTLPEPTPVHEAASLQADLLRAGITPFAWVINQSLAASGTRDPLLLAKAAQEAGILREVDRLTNRRIVLPWTREALDANEREA